MNFAAFLVGMVGPMTVRLLASLGLSLVTMAGMTAAASALRSAVLSNLNGLPLEAIQLGGLLGLWQCFGMMLGAVTFSITWASTKGAIGLARTA